MSIAKLIVNMHKGKIDLKTNQEDCVLIEIELNMENNIYDEEKNNKTLILILNPVPRSGYLIHIF